MARHASEHTHNAAAAPHPLHSALPDDPRLPQAPQPRDALLRPGQSDTGRYGPVDTGLPDRYSFGKMEKDTQTRIDWSGMAFGPAASGFSTTGTGTARVQRRTEVSKGSPLATTKQIFNNGFEEIPTASYQNA